MAADQSEVSSCSSKQKAGKVSNTENKSNDKYKSGVTCHSCGEKLHYEHEQALEMQASQ